MRRVAFTGPDGEHIRHINTYLTASSARSIPSLLQAMTWPSYDKMEDHYTLPRHASESARLEAQHAAYVKTVGYLLHPRIAAALPENARVADVGTGTGIWLRELAQESPPTWDFVGLDISDAQFPQNRDAKQRVTFDTLNILEPIPERFRGQFDAVHLRLLTCGLVEGQWETVAANVLQLLRPGGWIQWHESQFKDIQFFQNVPGASRKCTTQVLDAAFAVLWKQGKMVGEEARLLEFVRGAGFEDDEEDLMSSDRIPEIRGMLVSVQFTAIEGIARNFLKDPAYPLSQLELESALEGMHEEVRDGKTYWQWNHRVVTARRPS